MIDDFYNNIIAGRGITKTDAAAIAGLPIRDISALFVLANRLRQHFRGSAVDLCAIINAKSGACPEDCSYCSQSASGSADIAVYPLLDKEIVLEKAQEARDNGVKRFCIVTSGRKPSKEELKKIAVMIRSVRDMGLLPCSTLGLLDKEELQCLRDSGLERYHHNLETSERFFPEICRTHTYYDKLKTIEAVHNTGLSLCSGGIFGMGETWEDRIDMAFALDKVNADSMPLNFLIPVSGTPLGHRDYMPPFETLKIISLYRFILPQKEIRVCGGRMQVLGEFNSMVFMAGADSLLTGNYLTTTGRTYEDDLRLINNCGLSAA